MANEQTVRIPINLEVVDSSIKNIQDILSKMKPDTAGFRQLSKILDELVKSSGKVQTAFDRGFSSNTELKAAEKEIRTMEGAMKSLEQLSKSISFKDLKLDANQQKTFDELERKLKIAQSHYSDLVKSFGSKDNAQAIQLIDKDLSKKSIEEIESTLNSAVERMKNTLTSLSTITQGLGDKFKSLKESKDNGTYKTGDALKSILGDTNFEKFFQNKKNGVFSFKSNISGGAKEAFISYLKESFTLTEEDIKKIRDSSNATDIEKIFSNQDTVKGLFKAGKKNTQDYSNVYSTLQQEVQNAKTEMATAGQNMINFEDGLINTSQVVPQLTAAFGGLSGVLPGLNANLGSVGEELEKISKQNQMMNNIKSMADRFLGLYQIIGYIKKGWHEMTTTIKELDSVMNGISIVTKMSTSDLWDQVDVYSAMAQKYGTSIKGAYEVSRIYYQQGLETKDVMTLTEETLKLSKISGLDYATTTDYMTTALRGFKMEMTDASKVVDVYSNLAANTAVSQQELAEAMTRTASSMESVGATFEETSAMIATMVAVTRETASNIGSAMKSIASRYGELTKDPTKLIDSEGEEMSFNKVDAALKSIGISMQTSDHQFRDFTEVILELSDAWNTLSSTQQRYVATQFAGNRQQSRFLALVSNGDLLRQNLQVAENSEDVGTTQALKALDSIETKINQVTTAWQQFYLNIGLEDLWKSTLDGITNVLTTLNELPKVFGKFPAAAIVTVTNAINLIRALIQSGISLMSKTLTGGFTSAGTQSGQAMGQAILRGVEPYLKALAQKAGAEVTQTVDKSNTTQALGGKIASVVNLIGAGISMIGLGLNNGSREAEELSGKLTVVAGTVQLIGAVIAMVTHNWAAAAAIGITAITSIVSGADLINETLTEKADRLQKTADNLNNTAKQYKAEEKSAESLIDKYHQLEKTRYESEEKSQEFQEVINDLAETFPQLVTGFDGFGNAIIETTQLEEVLAESRRKTAQATLEAAQAERDAKQAEIEAKREELKTSISSMKASTEKVEKIGVSNGIYKGVSKEGRSAIESAANKAYYAARSSIFGTDYDGYDLKYLSNFIKQYAKRQKISLPDFEDFSTIEEMNTYLLNNIDTLGEEYNDFKAATHNMASNINLDSSNNFYDALEQLNSALDSGDQAQIDDALYNFLNAYEALNESQKQYYSKIKAQADELRKNEKILGQKNTELNKADTALLKSKALVEWDYSSDENKKYSGLIKLGNSLLVSQYEAQKDNGIADAGKYYDSLKENNPILKIKELIDNNILNWTDEQFSSFNTAFDNLENYGNLNELKTVLGENFILPQELEDLLNSYYTETARKVQETATAQLKSLKTSDSKNAQYYSTLYGEVEDKISTEFNSSLELGIANQLTKAIKVFHTDADLEEMGNLGATIIQYADQVPTALADSMKTMGFSSVEQIDSYLTQLETLHDNGQITNDVYTGLSQALIGFRKNLINNLSLTIQSTINGLNKSLDTAISDMDKLQSGMGFEDAAKMITKLNGYLGDNDTKFNLDKDFTFDGKKFSITADAWNRAYTAIYSNLAEQKKKIESDITAYSAFAEQIKGKNINDINKDQETLKQFRTLTENLLGAETAKGYFDENGAIVVETAAELGNKLKDAGAALDEQWQSYESRLKYLDDYNAQIQLNFQRQDTVFKNLFSNPKDISVANVVEFGKKFDLGSSYSEIITSGLFTITNGIISMSAYQMKQALDEHGKQLSVESRNNLQAMIDAQFKSERGFTAATNIMSNWSGTITDDMLLAWADATGQELKAVQAQFKQVGAGKWAGDGDLKAWIEANGQQYNPDAEKTYGKYLETQRNAINSTWESVIKSLDGGIQRIEKNVNTDDFFEKNKSQLETFGIKVSEEFGYWVIDGFAGNTEQIVEYLSDSKNFPDMDASKRASLIESVTKGSLVSVVNSVVKNAQSVSASTAEQLAKVLQAGDIADLKALGVIHWDDKTQTYVANLSELYKVLGEMEKNLGDTQQKNNIEELRKQIKETQLDTLSTEIKSTTSGIKDGFSTYADAAAVLKTMNQNVQKTADGKQVDLEFSDLFEWNAQLNKYVYSLDGIATRFSYLKIQLNQATAEQDVSEIDRINKEITASLKEIGQSVDLMKAFSISGTTQEQAKARQDIANEVDKYNAAASQIEGAKVISQDLLNLALDGSIFALDTIYTTLGQTLTAENVKTVRAAKSSKIKAAAEALNAGVGTVIDQTTRELIGSAANFQSIGAGMSVITYIKDLEQAQYNLYNALKETNQATAQELNEAALRVLQARYQSEDTGLSLLQNGASMSIEQLAGFMEKLGQPIGELDEFIKAVNPYIERIGGSNIRVYNMAGLLSQYGLSPDSSELGRQYYSAWLDSIITAGDKAKEDALKVITTLQSASGGDQINAFGITGLNITKELEVQLSEFGAAFENGMITLAKNADIPSIISILLQYAQNKDLISADDAAEAAAKTITKDQAATTLAQNYNKASMEMLKNFARATGIGLEHVVAIFKDNGNGTYSGEIPLEDFIELMGLKDTTAGKEILRAYAESQRNVLSNFISTSITSITKGTQRIAITDENRELLAQLAQKYGGYMEEGVGEYLITVTEETAGGFITSILNDPDLTSYEKGEAVTQVRNGLKQTGLHNLLTTMASNYEDIPFNILNSVADQLGIGVEQLYAENGPIKFNGATQKYSTSLQDLYHFTEQLLDKGSISIDTASAVFKQIDDAFGNLTPEKLFGTFISSNGSITNEVITTFVEGWNKIADDYSKIAAEDISQFVVDGEIDTSTILGLMETFQVEMDETIAKQLKTKFDSYVTEVNGLASEITGGFTDTTKMGTILKQANRRFSRPDGSALEFDDLFEYNEELNKYVYTSTGMVTRIRSLKAGLSEIAEGTKEYDEALVNYDLAMKQFGIQLHEIGKNIDFMSIATAAPGSIELGKAIEKARYDLQTYNDVAAEIGETLIGTFSFDQLAEGGLAAVQLMQELYENLGRELSTDDIKKIYQGEVSNLFSTMEILEKVTKGGLIDQTTYELGQTAGLLTATEIGNTGIYEVTSVAYENLAQAYRNLYSSLKASGEATTEQLNQVALKIWGSYGSKEQTIISSLSSATGMTFEQFGTMLTELGIELTDSTIGEYAQYLTSVGGNKLVISDFKGLMDKLGFDSTSEEYQKAYSQYITSLISWNNEANSRVETAISNLQNAKVGDQINVYDLVGDLEMSSDELGYSIKNGILTITKGMNIPEIITAVLATADTKITADQKYLAERTANESSVQQLWLDIGKTYDSVSFDLIKKLAQAMGATIESVETTFFTKNADGSYAGKYNIQDIFTQYGVDLNSPVAQEVLRLQMQNYRDTIDSTIQSGLSSITGGVQRITKNAQTDEIFGTLLRQGATWIQEGVGEYLINVTRDNIKNFENFIRTQDTLTQRQQSNYIAQARQNLADKNISNILNTVVGNITQVSYQTASELALQLGYNSPEDLVTIEDSGWQGLFSQFNKDTQTFVLDVVAFSNFINEYGEQLGLSATTIKQLNNQLKQYSGYEVAKSFITSANNITDDMVTNLANITGLMEADIREKYLTKEAGTWRMSSRTALALAQEYDNANGDLVELWKNTYLDNIFNGISNIGGNIFTTSFDYNGLKQLVQDIQDWTGQTFDISQLASYNSQLQQFVLSQEGIFAKIQLAREQLKAAGMDSDLIDDQIQSMIDQFGKSLDFSKAFDFKAIDTTSRARNMARLNANAQAYYEMLYATGDIGPANNFKDNYETMLKGGKAGLEAAYNVYHQTGQELTAETAKNILEAPVQWLLQGKAALDSKVGDVISSNAAALGVAAGYLEVSETVDGLAQVIKINKDNLDNALWAYYDGIRQQMEQGVEGLTEESNNAVISIWEQRAAKDSAAVNAFDKAMGMTYKEFGEMAVDAGYELTVGLLDQFIGEGILEDIGNGKVRILDFDKFAEKMGYTDTNSEAYKEARSKYRDSVIQLNNQTRDDVLKNINAVKDAKIGDQINLSALTDALGEGFTGVLHDQLLNYGGLLNDGILTIGQLADIPNIAMTIAQAAQASGAILESDVLELGEALEKVFSDYINIITNGLKGGLKGSDQREMIRFAEQLGVNLSEKDFSQAADGLKLTTDAAIRLYNELRNIQGLDLSNLTAGIKDSLLARDNVTTMDGIMARIASINSQIEAQKAKTGEVNAELERELQLYKEIAQESMNDPNKYKFMDQALPDMFQGPLNYWDATEKMMQTMTASAKSGYMGVQDFYNIATEMENLAKLSGKTMSFMGVEIGEGAMTAAELVEKGFSNLKEVSGKGAQINLKGLSDIGLNLAMSSKQMAAGVEDGIHAMAKSQVDMLDGLIALLETIVAMEKLGDVDADNDHTLNLEEIFDLKVTGEKKLTDNMRDFSKDLFDRANQNEELRKQLEALKLGDYSLYQIIEDAADGVKDLDIATEDYVNLWNSLYKTMLDQDFDPSDITSIVKELGKNGLDLEYTLKDGRKMVIKNGHMIVQDEDKQWVYNGVTYSTADAALAAMVDQESKDAVSSFNKGKESKGITVDDNGEYTITIGGQKYNYKLEHDKQGNFFVDGFEGTYKTPAEAMRASFRKQFGDQEWKKGIKYSDLTDEQIDIIMGFKVLPKIDTVGDLTGEQASLLRKALNDYGIDTVEKLKENAENLSLELGFEVNPELFSSDAALQNFKGTVDITEANTTELKQIHVQGIVDIVAVEGLEEKVKQSVVAAITNNESAVQMVNRMRGEKYTDQQILEAVQTYSAAQGGLTWDEIQALSLEGKIAAPGTLGAFEGKSAETWYKEHGIVDPRVAQLGIKGTYNSATKSWEFYKKDIADEVNNSGRSEYYKSIGVNEDNFLDYINYVRGTSAEASLIKMSPEAAAKFWNSDFFALLKREADESAEKEREKGEGIGTNTKATIGKYDYGTQGILLADEAAKAEKLAAAEETATNNLSKSYDKINTSVLAQRDANLERYKTFDEYDAASDQAYSSFLESAAFKALEESKHWDVINAEAQRLAKENNKTGTEGEYQYLLNQYRRELGNEWFQQRQKEAEGEKPKTDADKNAQSANTMSNAVDTFQSAVASFGAMVQTMTMGTVAEKLDGQTDSNEIKAILDAWNFTTKDQINALINSGLIKDQKTIDILREQASAIKEETSQTTDKSSVSIDEQGEAQRRQDALGGAEAEQLRYMAEAEEQIIQAGQKYEEAVNAVTEGPLAQSSEVQAAWQEYQDALSMWKVYSGQDYADEHAVLSSPEAIDAIENSVQNIDTTTEQNNKNQEDIDAALSLVQDIGNKLSTLMQEREQEIEEPGSTEWEGDLPALDTEIAATLSDLGWAYSELESLTGDAASTIGAAGETISGTTTPISDAARALEALSSATSSANSAIDTTNSKLSAMKSADVHFDAYFNGSPVSGSHTAIINIQTKVNGNGQATGNAALASGTRTLMGELGPELVVSNGQYFLAGQNGAEFVDLAKDAIVFNHIQTKRLLSNGSSGRGTPLTNERNATSMATGNVRGPAMASASAVLSTLKQLRAQWQALADLSIADLAGKGGGGGGGGNKQIPGFIRDVERWYNWLQKIADLEKEITYQEQLRNKIQSDMISNGKAYYASQKQSYEDMRLSAITSESLYLSQKDYFEQRREQLNSKDSPLSTLYTFDESGQLHFQEGAYQWLADLFKADDYGHQALSPKQQYEMILAKNPQFAQFMKYDESGKEIIRKDYKSDDEYYLAMVKAFSERMDSEKEEMQELFDSLHEQEQKVLEQMQAMNEQLQAMKDNQKEVEESVLKAIEESRQRQIDEMKDTKEAIQKTNEDFIDGLNKSLEKERQMYEDTQKDQELERNRRQLAILKRSGASASQIAQLQEKVDQQARDQYFDKQQEQIDAVKEASDLQLEKMDLQIELAQEQLDYEKAHGLLWGQVYDVMAKTPQEIADFITSYTAEYWEKSPLSSAEDTAEILFKAEQWSAFRDDIGMQEASLGKINQNLDIFLAAMKEIHGKDAKWDEIEKTAKAKYENLFGGNNDDPGITAWQAYQSATELATKPATPTGGGAKTTTTGGGSGGGKTGKEKTWSYNAVYHYHKDWHNGSWSIADPAPHSWKDVSASSRHLTRKCTVCGATRTDDSSPGAKVDGKQYTEQQIASAQAILNKQTKNTKNAKGGVADYTGWTWIDGTLTEPEGILNADDYRAWKEDIKTTNLLYNALADVSALQHSAAAVASSTTNNNSGIVIEHAEVSMNATIANDYDARRAGEQALEQMLTIARKSGTRSAQRR